MDLLYVSCYPKEYFKELINNSNNKDICSQPAQKFNMLFVDGFQQNDANITVLSMINLLHWNNNKYFVKAESILEGGIVYDILPSIKIRYLNNLFAAYHIRKYLNTWRTKHPQGIIIMDFLKPYTKYISKYKKHNKLVTIVTDLPEFLMNSNGLLNRLKNRYWMGVYRKILDRSSCFVFLTEYMNLKLNRQNKPYCIIEGLVDYNMSNCNRPVLDQEGKICMYTGALNEQLGIRNLVKAFMSQELSNYELHLYGSGDCVPEIKRISETNQNIKYFGNVENSIVVTKQMKASVLINPRPTDKEFTKYSFPSKNMEYMVSGTPVITTKLAGMPDEYIDHVYLLEDYSVAGIIECVSRVLSKPSEELKYKGLAAKEFVLHYKNNITQTKKIIDML
jgi:glycosyltransferase involved in cell wall biosynthesis